MNKPVRDKVLKEHIKWLKGDGGQRADLSWADLSGAHLPPPTQMLLCYWGEVSPKLTLSLMRYDASNHPEPEEFDKWAEGGEYPYQRGFARCANFQEQRELWRPGKPKSARELVLLLFKEKEIKFDSTL